MTRQIQTFDIFDTLVARRCIDPFSIFVQVEKKTGWAGGADARRAAEMALVGLGRTFTFPDIYKRLAADHGLSHEFGQSLMRAEIAAEIENAIPIRENIERVRKGDVLITDMYLPRDVISLILAKVGIGKDHGLIVSLDGKSSGRVWPAIKEVVSVAQHTGDNAHSDVSSPQSSKILSHHCSQSNLSPCEHFLFSNGFKELARFVRTLRLTCMSRNAGMTEYDRLNLQISYNIPILILTCFHLRNLVVARKIENILFCSRDCYYMWLMFSELNLRLGWNIRAEYFYTSRRCRKNPTSGYLDYFRSMANVNSLVVDLCGSGGSLHLLYERAGFYPYTFLLHYFRDAHRADCEKSNMSVPENRRFDSICDDLSLNNIHIELMNAVDSGMAVDVAGVAGFDGFIPVFEDPHYTESAKEIIFLIDEINTQSRQVMGGVNFQDLSDEFDKNAAAAAGVMDNLYRDMFNHVNCMADLLEYIVRHDFPKNSWHDSQ
jgi:hypothetical protein